MPLETFIEGDAGVDVDAADCVELCKSAVAKKYDRIMTGKIGIREGGRQTNPVTAEAIELALGTVRGEYKKNGKKLNPKAMLAEAKKKVGIAA